MDYLTRVDIFCCREAPEIIIAIGVFAAPLLLFAEIRTLIFKRQASEGGR